MIKVKVTAQSPDLMNTDAYDGLRRVSARTARPKAEVGTVGSAAAESSPRGARAIPARSATNPPPAWNMAVDDALLQRAGTDAAPLRLVAARGVARLVPAPRRVRRPAAGTPIVRRRTGGGAIHHGDESRSRWRCDGRALLPRDVAASYVLLHDAVVTSPRRLRHRLRTARCRPRADARPIAALVLRRAGPRRPGDRPRQAARLGAAAHPDSRARGCCTTARWCCDAPIADAVRRRGRRRAPVDASTAPHAVADRARHHFARSSRRWNRVPGALTARRTRAGKAAAARRYEIPADLRRATELPASSRRPDATKTGRRSRTASP
jgi:hypothetical protein